MSRRNSAPVRKILPDPKYNSLVVAKLINQVMIDGKKGISQSIVYDALDVLEQKTGLSAMEALDKVLENVMPLVETKPRKVGGASYQVPVEVRPARKQTLAIRWIVLFAKKRGERGMENRLAGELFDAYNSTGGAVKRKDEVHRMAEANKAFAHFKY
ncbi:MAG: 30S ribosomal protein S7 [Clostridia bacterium]|nr:30S ribosomal protein S7 [Clostridia bacterium]